MHPLLIRPRPGPALSTGLLAAAALLLVGCTDTPPPPEPRPAPPVLGRLPPFELVDQDGAKLTSRDLRGRPWLATFVFTRCGSTCPRQTEQFAAFHERFAADPELAGIRLVSFTVDPAHDRPAVLSEHAQRVGAQAPRWRFVTGEPGRLRALIRDGFHLPVEDTPENPDSILAHSSQFVLVDAELRIRSYRDGLDPAERETLVAELRRVAREPAPPPPAGAGHAAKRRELPLPALSRSLAFRLAGGDGAAFGSNELWGRPWLSACPGESEAPQGLLDAAAELAGDRALPLLIGSANPAPTNGGPGRRGLDVRPLLGGESGWPALCEPPFAAPGAEAAPSEGPRLALVDSNLRVRGVYGERREGDAQRLRRDLERVLAEPPPVPAHPETVSPAWLPQRAAQQRAAAQGWELRHDFRFRDRRAESGITFLHRATPDGHRDYKLCHYDHGNAVATADVDGDGRLDLFFTDQVGGNELWRNLGDGRFEDITARAGVAAAERICVAASFGDTDGDGDADLLVTTVMSGNLFFENDGAGRFADRSEASGLDHRGHSSAAVLFDYDRDGRLDVFLANVGAYTSDEIAPAPTRYKGEPPGPVHRYRVGFEDAFAGHLKPERAERSLLFRNLGGNRFEDVSEAVGLEEEGWNGAATPIDANGDGWPDLYVADMQGLDEYWENDGGTRFRRRGRELFPRSPWGAMGLKVFDFDGDERLDLQVVDMHSDMWEFTPPERDSMRPRPEVVPPQSYLRDFEAGIYGNALFRNLGSSRYEEIAERAGAETYWPWGLSVGDLNADGLPDAFVTACMNFNFRYHPNSLLLNDRGRRFLSAEYVLGVEPRRHGRTAKIWFELDCGGADEGHAECERAGTRDRLVLWSALGSRSSVLLDLEGDGDLDIVTNDFNSEPLVLVSDLAQTGPVSWLAIELVGTRSNRDGLGARVTVEAGGRRQVQVHDGQSGYLAQSRAPLWFGLADAESVDRIELRWPSGREQVVEGPLPAGRRLTITEAE